MPRQERRVPAFPFEFGPYGTSTRVYDTFRKTHPVHRVSLPSGLHVWLVTTYTDVCTVHREPTFSRAEAVRAGATLIKSAAMELEPNVLQNTDGEQHSTLHRVFAMPYAPDHIPRWPHTSQAEAQPAIDGIEGRKIFDPKAPFFAPVANRCPERFFASPADAMKKIQLELFFDR